MNHMIIELFDYMKWLSHRHLNLCSAMLQWFETSLS